ncbi:uncharacterized protein LOC111832444 [Capsella rubella]|uniref:uncharacterized protein LOC111832444 n=1 Tax=Capsella rubella TaxID=81985 RepID=UPI000CD4B403|nr:uncharacterized protein LOC111832444 [Capsella rubella]
MGPSLITSKYLRLVCVYISSATVGNGTNLSFWGDTWTPFGPLLHFIGSAGPTVLRIPLSATVADATAGLSWGMQIDPLCCLCSAEVETRHHLLLTCHFSRCIWENVFLRLKLPPLLFRDWNHLISWTLVQNRSPPPTLRKLVAQASVYAIWKQRNNILHNSQVITPLSIFKIIDREVRNSISARRHRKKFKDLMSRWII